jgi:hypothetical protein
MKKLAGQEKHTEMDKSIKNPDGSVFEELNLGALFVEFFHLLLA